MRSCVYHVGQRDFREALSSGSGRTGTVGKQGSVERRTELRARIRSPLRSTAHPRKITFRGAAGIAPARTGISPRSSVSPGPAAGRPSPS